MPTGARNVAPGTFQRGGDLNQVRSSYSSPYRGRAGGGYSGGGGIFQQPRSRGGTRLYGARTPGAMTGMGLRVPTGRARNPIASLYERDIRGRPLGLPGNSQEDPAMRGFRTWVNPNVVLAEDTSHHNEAAVQAGLPAEQERFDERSKVTFNHLIEDYIKGRREAYLTDGWQLFREREYLRAMDKFALADAVSMDDAGARSEVKNALLIGALASRQYATAIHAVSWLLGQDPRTGQIRDAGFLRKLPKLSDIYARGATGTLPDYERHLQDVEQFAARNPNMHEAQVMLALVLWLDDSPESGRRGRALRNARQLDRPGIEPMWRALSHLMEYALEESRRDAPASPLPSLIAPADQSALENVTGGVEERDQTR